MGTTLRFFGISKGTPTNSDSPKFGIIGEKFKGVIMEAKISPFKW